MKLFFASLFTSVALLAQTLIQVPAPPSPQVAVQSVGVSGFTTYYYLVIANYPAGATQSVITAFAGGNATLTSSNYNQVGWQALPGALNYDVLRLSTNAFTGTCTCSVTVATSSLTFSDQGGSLSSYTVGAPALQANATVYVDNTTNAFPKLRVSIGTAPQGTQTSHLAEVPSGNTLPVYCNPGDVYILLSGNIGNFNCFTANVWTIGGPSLKSTALTLVQLQTLNTVGVQLLPAFGANTWTEIIGCALDLKRGSAAFTGGGVVTIGWGSTSAVTAGAATIAATVFTSFAASQSISVAGLLPVTANTLILNLPVWVNAATADFAAGTGATGVLDCRYEVHSGF